MQERVELIGPELAISAEAVTPLALTLHELATNAAKYGALSVSAGRVKVTWKAVGDLLDIVWVESGGTGGIQAGEEWLRHQSDPQKRGKPIAGQDSI